MATLCVSSDDENESGVVLDGDLCVGPGAG